MIKVKTRHKTEDTAGFEYGDVLVDASNIGVSNGTLYLMSDTGRNAAVFAREEWVSAIVDGAQK